jgi:hypothetical protein
MQALLRILPACALAALLLVPSVAQAQNGSSTTTTTTTVTQSTTVPAVGETTTLVTTTDATLGSTTTTVQGPDGMLYTTTMSPALQPDVFRVGPADAFDRNGYGDMYDLNRGHTIAYLDGTLTDIDLNANRVDVKLTADAYYEPSQMGPSDGFERGLLGPQCTNFDADVVEIQTGTTVTFWADTGHHAISEYDGPVVMDREAPIDTSRTWSHTFNTPGWYRFKDDFGGGPTQDKLAGIFIHVKGPQVYSYIETTSTVALLPSTVTTTQQEQTTIQTTEVPTPQPQVQVQAARPKQQVVAPQPRNKDIK